MDRQICTLKLLNEALVYAFAIDKIWRRDANKIKAFVDTNSSSKELYKLHFAQIINCQNRIKTLLIHLVFLKKNHNQPYDQCDKHDYRLDDFSKRLLDLGKDIELMHIYMVRNSNRKRYIKYPVKYVLDLSEKVFKLRTEWNLYYMKCQVSKERQEFDRNLTLHEDLLREVNNRRMSKYYSIDYQHIKRSLSLQEPKKKHVTINPHYVNPDPIYQKGKGAGFSAELVTLYMETDDYLWLNYGENHLPQIIHKDDIKEEQMHLVVKKDDV